MKIKILVLTVISSIYCGCSIVFIPVGSILGYNASNKRTELEIDFKNKAIYNEKCKIELKNGNIEDGVCGNLKTIGRSYSLNRDSILINKKSVSNGEINKIIISKKNGSVIGAVFGGLFGFLIGAIIDINIIANELKDIGRRQNE